MSVEVPSPLRVHPSEDMLEEYSFARLQEPALSAVEEHLLMCEQCQSNLAELDGYHLLMREAIKEYEILLEDRKAEVGLDLHEEGSALVQQLLFF